jgi:dienelactone hydrolase
MALSSKLLEAADSVTAAQAQAGLRHALCELLADPIAQASGHRPDAAVLNEERFPGYRQQLVDYEGAADRIPAYVLIPEGEVRGGVVVYHQHNGEWHLGKSEVIGDGGSPRQAFGPALARRGLMVLAPDALGFEDRRPHATGTTPDRADGANHLWEMTSRLVTGRLLMRDVLFDAATALGVLSRLGSVDETKVGVAGHSFGGHVALFHAALDERVRFACISGAAGSYRNRLATRTGIGLEQAIPGVVEVTDFDGLAALVAPRPLHLISATNDLYAADADQIEQSARTVYRALGADPRLTHLRVAGEHALDDQRATDLVDWLVEQVGSDIGRE